MMKKLFLLLVVTLGGLTQAGAADKVEFALFFSPSCVHCNKLKQEYWGQLKQKYQDRVHFTEYDITQNGNHLIFQETAKAYGVPPQKLGYPAAAVGSEFLVGYPAQIGVYAETAIEKAILLNEKTNV